MKIIVRRIGNNLKRVGNVLLMRNLVHLIESAFRYRQNLPCEPRRNFGRVYEREVNFDPRSLFFRFRDIEEIEEEAGLKGFLFFDLRKRFILLCKLIMSRVIHGFLLFVRFCFLET